MGNDQFTPVDTAGLVEDQNCRQFKDSKTFGKDAPEDFFVMAKYRPDIIWL